MNSIDDRMINFQDTLMKIKWKLINEKWYGMTVVPYRPLNPQKGNKIHYKKKILGATAIFIVNSFILTFKILNGKRIEMSPVS